MLKNRFIKGHHGYCYSEYNHGKTGKQAKRNRRLGTHIIRSHLKLELLEIKKELGI